jgi:hypothetical protein
MMGICSPRINRLGKQHVRHNRRVTKVVGLPSINNVDTANCMIGSCYHPRNDLPTIVTNRRMVSNIAIFRRIAR